MNENAKSWTIVNRTKNSPNFVGLYWYAQLYWASSSPTFRCYQVELDNNDIAEINPVQALLLYNIGTMELTAGILWILSRVNVFNSKTCWYRICPLRKIILTSPVRVKLTQGSKSRFWLKICIQHTTRIRERRIIDIAGIEDICLVCKDFERFWTDSVRYGD